MSTEANKEGITPRICRIDYTESTHEWCMLDVEITLGYGYCSDSIDESRLKFRLELEQFIVNWGKDQ